MLLPVVIACIVLDAVQQSWLEWKRLLWGGIALAIYEKIQVTLKGATRS